MEDTCGTYAFTLIEDLMRILSDSNGYKNKDVRTAASVFT